MELAEYFRALRARWRWLLAGLLVGLSCAGIMVGTTTAIYEAHSRLFVSTPGGADSNQLNSGGTFSQQRVKSYAQIVTLPEVLDPVVEKLRLPGDSSDLADRIAVDAPLDTVVVDIAVRDQDARQAARIANEVGASLITVVDELERSGGETSPVHVSPVGAAKTPDTPVIPDTTLILGVGLVLGLLLGVAAAVVRHATDTLVRSDTDLNDLTGAAVLGEIPYDRQAAGDPALLRESYGPRAEAFRTLRTNLQFIEATGRLNSVVITSSVAREGKTTTAINLALTLVDSGMRVVLVDADLRRPQVANYLGLVNSVGLTTVLTGRIQFVDAVQRWGDGLYVLTSGDLPPNPSELLGAPPMAELLRRLENDFDLVIVDTSPLVPVTDGALLAARASGALVLVGVDRVRRDELVRSFRALAAVGGRQLGLVRNLVPTRSWPSVDYYSGKYEAAPRQRRWPLRDPRKRSSLVRTGSGGSNRNGSGQ